MLAAIISSLHAKKYKIYTRPFELNIVGVRSNNTIPNSFDDKIHVYFRNSQKKWVHYSFAATTDPGTYWLQNPMNPQGTAILRQGQYENAYQVGLHRGQYSALVQVKPVTVLRDYDRNAVLDFLNGKPETGLFGINIHRASVTGTTISIDKNSAGCQVFADAQGFNLFMQLCGRHAQQYGNSFTYTLIDKRSVAREQRKKLAGIAVGFGTAFITYQLLKP